MSLSLSSNLFIYLLFGYLFHCDLTQDTHTTLLTYYFYSYSKIIKKEDEELYPAVHNLNILRVMTRKLEIISPSVSLKNLINSTPKLSTKFLG